MGREIRRVPTDFQHPTDWYQRIRRDLFSESTTTRWRNEFKPMYDKTHAEAVAEWEQECRESLESGLLDEVSNQDDLDGWERDYPHRTEDIEQIRRDLGKPKWASIEDYCGGRPEDDDGYQPEGWPPVDERGWAVYETVSEGTPLTPTFATAEELVDWLTEKGTSSDPPMSREAAERFVTGGWAPSLMVTGGRVYSGLEAHEDGGPLSAPDSASSSDASPVSPSVEEGAG